MKASQIKFKAWDNEEECFVRKGVIEQIPTQNTRFGFKLNTVFELFQYTGEKDMAKREIYDGDILEVSLYPHLDRVVVKFQDGIFGIDTPVYEEFVDNFTPLGKFIGYWYGRDATVIVVGHIKTHKL